MAYARPEPHELGATAAGMAADWRSLPGFSEKFGACRELCEDFQGGAFSRAASV